MAEEVKTKENTEAAAKSSSEAAKTKADSKDPHNLAQVQSVTYLAYLGILLLVPLLMHQDNKFVKFHVNQGLVLAITMIALSFILSITVVLLLLAPLLWVVGIVYVVIGLVNVSKGEMKPLPLIGKFQIIK